MKHLSRLITLFFLISTFFNPQTSSAQIVATPLTATVSGTVITATLTGVSAENVEKVNIFTQISSFPISGSLCPVGVIAPPCTDTQPTKEVLGTTIKWTIKERIAGKTLYNIRAEGKNGYAFISNVVQIRTGMETIDATWPLTSTTTGTSAYIGGKIKNSNIGDFTAKLEYSIEPLRVDGTTTASTYGPKQSLKSNTNNAAYGIEADGTYYYRLTDLTVGTTYSIRQTIETKNGAREIKVGAFNSSTGIIPENSVNQALSDAQRSYSLLAPLPGLNVVLDNDLCREYVTQGKPVPGGSCDNQISYFINLIIRFLIGLSVVVLVVKIIFEGYQYMVTDIPFIKASAKSKLFESFFGLLLALASFLILNTINPRLVSSDLNIADIDLSIDEADENDYTPSNLPPLTGISIPTGTAKQLAEQIIASSSIQYITLKDEPRATPKQNVINTSKGEGAWTSIRAHGGARQAALNEKMLGALLAISKKYPISLTEINGGRHSGPNSKHYKGAAFDITASESNPEKNKAILDICRFAGAKEKIGPCNSYGSKVCSQTGYTTNTSHKTHIHCGW